MCRWYHDVDFDVDLCSTGLIPKNFAKMNSKKYLSYENVVDQYNGLTWDAPEKKRIL